VIVPTAAVLTATAATTSVITLVRLLLMLHLSLPHRMEGRASTPDSDGRVESVTAPTGGAMVEAMLSPSSRRVFVSVPAVLALLLAPQAAEARHYHGTNHHDVLKGKRHNDVLKGKGGNDKIGGGGGNDRGYGGDGNDTVQGGAGNDKMYGENDNDRVTGQVGNDYLDGGPGNDLVQGGPGVDMVIGGDGVDDLDGGDGNDTLDDGPGDDHLSADAGDDVLRVGEGADDVHGEEGGDTIYLLNDGVKDTVYCGPTDRGDPGDAVILVNGRDPLDVIANCPPPQVQRLAGPWSLLKRTLS
jgi:Ca2+-binding RTX toxin-like protein